MKLQPVTVHSGALRLRAELALPDSPGPLPGAVICHPHPLYGGDMHNNVVMGVHDALLQCGFATLRFNFRGAGGSEGVHENGIAEVDDVLAALRFLAAAEGVDAARLALVGYSFGAGVALRASQGSSSSPFPVGEGDGETSLKSKAAPAPARDIAVRALAAIGCPPRAVDALTPRKPLPCLFIAGERDHIASPQALKPAVARLPQPAHVVPVPRADHFFVGHEDTVGVLVADFIGQWLSAPMSGIPDAGA